MNLEWIHLSLTIILVVFSLAILAYQCKRWITMLAIVIPLAIGLSYLTVFTVEGLKGYPSKHIVQTKYLLLAYAVDKPKTWIFIWAVSLSDKSRTPYSMQIPYSKKMEESLKSAANRSQHGVPVIMQQSNDDEKSPFEFYNLPYAPNTLKPERYQHE